jgi:DNA-binding NarL/FixJ family response regulator
MGTVQQTGQPLLVLVLNESDTGRDPAVGAMAATLRRAVPGVRLVVTSRERIAILAEPAAAPQSDALVLSPREREVLPLLAAGLTNREIGAEIHLSADAIKKHVSAILRKLGARNRTEAARLAAALTLPSTSPTPIRSAV